LDETPIMGTAGNQKPNTFRRDLFVALQCGAFAALMGGLCCAAVPLYSWFRAAEVAGALPHSTRLSSVGFDRDLAAALAFRPLRNSVAAQLGRAATVAFKVANPAGPIGAGEAGCRASAQGLCFEKIDCLCLAPQTMRHAERVVLCVDPKLADDPGPHDVSTITLLRTFHPARARPPGSGPARLTGRT
jgi:cytochrome c oxidase assembly protein Cox11